MEMSEPIRKIRARQRDLRFRRWLALLSAIVGAAASVNGLSSQPHPSHFQTLLFVLIGVASIAVFLMATVFWKQYVRWFNRRPYMVASEAGDSEIARRVAG
jgi:hypothetical protein